MASDGIESGFDSEKEAAALRALEGEAANFLRRRLLFWAIRWSIGFAIIALVVKFQPNWSWL